MTASGRNARSWEGALHECCGLAKKCDFDKIIYLLVEGKAVPARVLPFLLIIPTINHQLLLLTSTKQ